MSLHKIDNRAYYQSDLLCGLKTVSHCFTTKLGGASRGSVCGLNLGFRCGDERESVEQNYRLVAEDFGFDVEKITAGRQTHSTNIKIIDESHSGKGVSRESDFEDIDGLVTNVSGLPLVVYYADCVPVLLADEVSGVVAAVHSGWRGTVGEIARNAVSVMVENFGAKPENIKAAIGPSIGVCCFETGEEVAGLFGASLVKSCGDGKFKVDLWSANKIILENCGVKTENIDVLGICTMCHSDMLYSYRVHKGETGRMGAFIGLK